MTPYHPVTWSHGAYALPILPLKWPIGIAFIDYSATDQASSIKFSSKYAQMDFYTYSTFKFQIDRGLGLMTQFRNFGILITFERIKLSASNLVRK